MGASQYRLWLSLNPPKRKRSSGREQLIDRHEGIAPRAQGIANRRRTGNCFWVVTVHANTMNRRRQYRASVCYQTACIEHA